jgi:hypothetical protein
MVVVQEVANVKDLEHGQVAQAKLDKLWAAAVAVVHQVLKAQYTWCIIKGNK